jgi:hypothetical protein
MDLTRFEYHETDSGSRVAPTLMWPGGMLVIGPVQPDGLRQVAWYEASVTGYDLKANADFAIGDDGAWRIAGEIRTFPK